MRGRVRWLRGCVIGLTMMVMAPVLVRADEPADLAGRIAYLLKADNHLGKMSIGLRIDALAGGGAVIFERNSRAAFKPASNQKLITTAAALAVLPADFTYRTILGRRGEDLVIIGAGDPAFGDPQLARQAGRPITAALHKWAEQLKAAGVTEIKGDLLFDDFIFEQQHLPPSWGKQHHLENWYAAPAGGLNFNDNCVDVVIKPAAKVGQPAEVTLLPDSPYTKLVNTSKTAKKGEPLISRKIGEPLIITVSGSVSRGNDEQNPFSVAVVDPGAFFAATARTVFAGAGIKITGPTRRQRVRLPDGSLPADLRIVAEHRQKLSDMLWRVNKSSQNMFAEALLKTVGAYAPLPGGAREGSYETGRAVIRDFLTRTGAAMEGIVIDDGSGLSHDNRLTPEAVIKVLTFMDHHPRREEFWASLAAPGEKEGTLRKRMGDLKGRVFAKTGYVAGVSVLSGYATAPGDRRYAFSVLCNDINKAKNGLAAAHKLQDALCRLLAAPSPKPVAQGG